MVMQDIITQVKYQLPIINVVFSNEFLWFYRSRTKDTEQKKFGVFWKMQILVRPVKHVGANSFTITDYHQLRPAFDAAQSQHAL